MTAEPPTITGDGGGLYDRLGVAEDAGMDALRAAYRRRAMQLHPDRQRDATWDAQLQMALVNEAWSVLSDPQQRRTYDGRRAEARAAEAAAAATPARAGRPSPFIRSHQPAQPRIIVTRKEAWLDGMAVRIRFLAGYAGRSAVQAMLLRHPGTARATWDAIVPIVCRQLSDDTGDRVRRARMAGAAPLDLANAAALIGLGVYGGELIRGATPGAASLEDRLRHAEMVDRIYETLAYELPRELVHQLGNAPRVLRQLAKRR